MGNRTAYTRTITSTLATTYTHDAANRLATQNGQSLFTWDANGNLLADGSTTYGYDFANQLISATVSGVNTQFAYNGDGVRLRLVEAGTLTTYTQDYAAPLPVVLQAKTGSAATQYVYSLGTRPVTEYESSAGEYLLADPLGSVRQLADASGNVLLSKSYEPYGSVLNSQGTATSIFAYAGEQVDTTGLIFLRARYMSPRLGVFLSRDPWEGDALRPGSMNGWNYVEGNPVNLLDPSGHSTDCPPYMTMFGIPVGFPCTEDPLTSERWRLAKQEARRFQIPIELVAGTVAAEIVHDTDIWESTIDAFLLKLPLSVLYCLETAHADKWAAKLWLDWYNSHGQVGTGPGPGVANVHVASAVAAEDWINSYYPGQGLLDKPANIYIRLTNLLLDEGNIRYTAGILRQLADQRTGRAVPHAYEPAPKSNPANLTDLDMQVIFEGFRAGTQVYDEDDEEADFQTSNNPKTYGPQIAVFLSYYREKANRGE